MLTQNSPTESFFIGLGVGWAVAPVYVYVLGLTEGRWLKFGDQFRGFMPGDIALGPVLGAACYLAASAHRAHGLGSFFEGTFWVVFSLVLGVVLAVGLSIVDILRAVHYKPGATDKFHWRQLITVTKVYHNIFVYAIYCFLLVRIGLLGLLLAPWDLVAILIRLLLVACLAAWVLCLMIDIRNPGTKFNTAYVRVKWWKVCLGYLLLATTIFVVILAVPAAL